MLGSGARMPANGCDGPAWVMREPPAGKEIVACVREMNRSGSERTSVLISPRPMVPPASSKRADNSRSSGRPLKETARIVSIAPTFPSFPEQIREGVERFYSRWVGGVPPQSAVLRRLRKARLPTRPGGADGGTRQASQTADVSGAHGASPQDRSRLKVLARAASGASRNPATRTFSRAGVQQVPRHER